MQHNASQSAQDFLNEASNVMAQRGKEYEQGTKERSMEKVVQAFNAITGHSLDTTQGWMFMMLLKMVRSQNNSGFHYDSYLDLVAYSALTAESAVPPSTGPQ